MNKNLTDIVMVVDRSGSMQSIREEAEGGLNAFVEDQKKQTGDARLTLVQFDTEYEFVHDGMPVKDVPKFTLVPRGWTALLDAVGRAVVQTGARLEKLPESDRPGLVVFVVVTDGQENSSKEFKLAKVKEMIEHQQNVYGWKFIYLGANQDSFAEAGKMGFAAAGVADYTEQTSGKAYAKASNLVGTMRSARSSDAPVLCSFSDEDRKDLKK